MSFPWNWPKQKPTITAGGVAPPVTHDLRQAVRDYIGECDNPVPDYSYRRVLRNRLRDLAGCPPEPTSL